MNRRRQPPLLFKLAFGLALASVLLGMAELATQFSGIAPAYQPDLIGGWRMMGEQKDQIVHGVKEAHEFRLSTNTDGLRSTLKRERQAGLRRVALMGDSTTFGWGADDGQTVADGLELGLRERGATDIEVLNAAQPGYSTTQIARFFQQIVAHYRPDLVVVFLPMHDHNLVLVSDAEHLRGAQGPLAGARVWLATRSSLYEGLRRALFPASGQAFLVPERDHSAEPRVPRASPAERAESFAAMAEALESWGGRLALGHLPFIGDLTSAAPVERLGVEEARAWSDRAGRAVVDLRACCGPDGAHLVLPYDSGHLSGEGNLRVGRAAAEPVLELLGPP